MRTALYYPHNRPGKKDGDEFKRAAKAFAFQPAGLGIITPFTSWNELCDGISMGTHVDLAICTHGFPYGLNVRRMSGRGTPRENAVDLAALLDQPRLKRLSLFACCTAGRPVAERDSKGRTIPPWVGPVFAEELSKELPSVYIAAQEQSAHVFRNPWDVLYLGGRRIYQAPRLHRGATRAQQLAWIRWAKAHDRRGLSMADVDTWKQAEKDLGFSLEAR